MTKKQKVFLTGVHFVILPPRYCVDVGVLFSRTVLQHVDRLDSVVSLQLISRATAMDTVSP